MDDIVVPPCRRDERERAAAVVQFDVYTVYLNDSIDIEDNGLDQAATGSLGSCSSCCCCRLQTGGQFNSSSSSMSVGLLPTHVDRRPFLTRSDPTLTQLGLAPPPVVL